MTETNRAAVGLASGFLLIGGHAVTSALLSHQFRAAIFALTTAVCVLVISSVERSAVAKTPRSRGDI
jgi:hypothetical protein